ncbi:MAG: hypothetical protein PHR35_19945 [Kiritimatiellae bacterium]|nr:hypothetical protein [Kiritimatiellia bacterium]
MIYRDDDDAAQPSGGGASRLLPRLLREMAESAGEALPLSETQVEELARAVDAFIAQQGGQPDADNAPYVAMLASRALNSLGAGDVAKRLLVYGTGLLRPALWEISLDDAMWVLDLRRLTVASGAPLELTLFRCLDVVVSATADVWDATRGAGMLGLRHVCGVAAEMLNRGLHTPEARRLADDLGAHVAAQLEALRAARCWQQTPEVVNLDF